MVVGGRWMAGWLDGGDGGGGWVDGGGEEMQSNLRTGAEAPPLPPLNLATFGIYTLVSMKVKRILH